MRKKWNLFLDYLTDRLMARRAQVYILHRVARCARCGAEVHHTSRLEAAETDLQKFVDEQGKWSDTTFAGQTIPQKLEHLREEIDEIMNAPADVVEYADAAMILLNAVRVAGFSVKQLQDAMRFKLAINKKREWKDFRHVEG